MASVLHQFYVLVAADLVIHAVFCIPTVSYIWLYMYVRVAFDVYTLSFSLYVYNLYCHRVDLQVMYAYMCTYISRHVYRVCMDMYVCVCMYILIVHGGN